MVKRQEHSSCLNICLFLHLHLVAQSLAVYLNLRSWQSGGMSSHVPDDDNNKMLAHYLFIVVSRLSLVRLSRLLYIKCIIPCFFVSL